MIEMLLFLFLAWWALVLLVFVPLWAAVRIKEVIGNKGDKS